MSTVIYTVKYTSCISVTSHVLQKLKADDRLIKEFSNCPISYQELFMPFKYDDSLADNENGKYLKTLCQDGYMNRYSTRRKTPLFTAERMDGSVLKALKESVRNYIIGMRELTTHVRCGACLLINTYPMIMNAMQMPKSHQTSSSNKLRMYGPVKPVNGTSCCDITFSSLYHEQPLVRPSQAIGVAKGTWLKGTRLIGVAYFSALK